MEVETVAKGLYVPWSITFLNEDEAVFTERNGFVKLLTISNGRVETVARIEVTAIGEGGLLGV
ncbi:MAG: PQQ-dependent sugar dehydrogenase, partial [Nitrososphaerota archaeon]|nr:PQQ-dependent sugar dehydrogenase [Nitrososphaerota archaeon]